MAVNATWAMRRTARHNAGQHIDWHPACHMHASAACVLLQETLGADLAARAGQDRPCMPTTLHAGQPHLLEYLPVGYMPWWHVPTAEGFAAVPDVPPGVEINVTACFSSQANLHTTNSTCVEAGAAW